MTNHQCDCTNAYDLLAKLLDAPCTPATRAELQAKIASCPHCFERLGLEQEVRAILRKSCAEEAPAYLRRRISVSIRYYSES